MKKYGSNTVNLVKCTVLFKKIWGW